MAEHSPTAAADTLFGDALTCDTDVPVALRTLAPDAGSIERALDQSETILRSLALIEDSPHEERDEHGQKDIALHRMEAKLNLVLETLASMLRRDRSDLPMQRIRWSRHGVEMRHPEPTPPDKGFLLIQPLVWLPQRLELPIITLAHASLDDGGSRVWLQFKPLTPNLQQALERHLFRLHRRELAARKPESRSAT
ncbi:PilZ domain-containing protein [Pseudomarimonas arenosa]|uniref:PilZ domain-containing protein n=1 Tax=Pseudomarimonas arenosa TaxID=2774145 RepID=A0AAW3ZJ49_9GAMM|nr:PilZ domain-containing protein [Pseudomarimonas arenosa]MBD8524744.1 PilZ domain-containing protein [Pseudomarimonas arenosa]